MAYDVLRERLLDRHEHGRPDDAVEPDDLLAYEMNVGRPVFVIQFRIVRVAESGDIVRQGVEPDVDHVLFVDRHRYAPVETRPRYAEIVEPLPDE